jgi:hypothetical protein
MATRWSLVAVALVAALAAAPARAQRYGFVRFPQDENMHQDGFDYWWGAADLRTTSGHHYTVTDEFTSAAGYSTAADDVAGFISSATEVFAHQGPYQGLSLVSEDGPPEWGHPDAPPGRYVSEISRYLPGVSELLSFKTVDTTKALKPVSSWQRTTLKAERYRLRVDDTAAEVFPTGRRIRLGADLVADMKGPPLLAGGTGRWWYGIPSTYHYPSRSFQYMQAARRLTGTIDIGGHRETVDPAGSTLEMVHEYDAAPEDFFAGFVAAEATQLHPRYAPYYPGGIPWELFFGDLDDGAQLMVAVLAFHDTPDGTLRPVIGKDQPTYKVLATLRLPDGRSVPLDAALHVEHLSYRQINGQTPGPFIQVKGIWKQAWDVRVSFGGGRVRAGDGSVATVPPFDLGLTPQLAQDEPKLAADGTGLTQRVPYDIAGSYGGCPVHGFAYSETIINWYRRESRDPWWTGGSKPEVPARCGDPVPAPPTGTPGNLSPPPTPTSPPHVDPESCHAGIPDPATCTLDATAMGGVSGYGAAPGGWTATITRPGLNDPIVIRSFGGFDMYTCGTIEPGDHVVVTTEPGSNASAGNPGTCI